MIRHDRHGGFLGFDEYIRNQGGIVSRRELLAAGWTADELRIAYGLGTLRRLRRGWYRSSDVPDEVVRAWRHGGPLACISALRWYGVTTPEHPGTDDGVLHICLPPHAHRRAVHQLAAPSPVIVHWHDSGERPRAQWAVPPQVAFTQARHCPVLRQG